MKTTQSGISLGHPKLTKTGVLKNRDLDGRQLGGDRKTYLTSRLNCRLTIIPERIGIEKVGRSLSVIRTNFQTLTLQTVLLRDYLWLNDSLKQFMLKYIVEDNRTIIW